jgi:hypothetical protein
MAAVSVISTVSRSAIPGWLRSNAERPVHQSGSLVEAAETLTLALSPDEAIISAATRSSTR